MYRFAGGHRRVHGRAVDRVAFEVALGDGFIDARDILVHHAPRAQAHMPYLGVAELTLGQADIKAGAGNQRVRRLSPQTVPGRRARARNGVITGLFPMAPAVENNQYGRAFGRCMHSVDSDLRRSPSGPDRRILTIVPARRSALRGRAPRQSPAAAWRAAPGKSGWSTLRSTAILRALLHRSRPHGLARRPRHRPTRQTDTALTRAPCALWNCFSNLPRSNGCLSPP